MSASSGREPPFNGKHTAPVLTDEEADQLRAEYRAWRAGGRAPAAPPKGLGRVNGRIRLRRDAGAAAADLPSYSAAPLSRAEVRPVDAVPGAAVRGDVRAVVLVGD